MCCCSRTARQSTQWKSERAEAALSKKSIDAGKGNVDRFANAGKSTHQCIIIISLCLDLYTLRAELNAINFKEKK